MPVADRDLELSARGGPGRVEAWRLEMLLAAGWAEFRAVLVAERFDVDLHAACELVERGCEQRLALRILL